MRNIFQFGDRESAAIARPNECAHASARNGADRNAFPFEDFQNSNVRDAAGKSSAQRQANGGNPGRRSRGSLAGEFPPKSLHRPNNIPQTFHSQPHISGRERPEVPTLTY